MVRTPVTASNAFCQRREPITEIKYYAIVHGHVSVPAPVVTVIFFGNGKDNLRTIITSPHHLTAHQCSLIKTHPKPQR